MTNDDLKNIIISEMGAKQTILTLKGIPHFENINIHRIYANLVSVLRSFTEDIQFNEPFNFMETITNQTAVHTTTVELLDDFDFIQEALDLIVIKHESHVELFVKGLVDRETSPFDYYRFDLFDKVNYRLSVVKTLKVKLLHGKAFSTEGAVLFNGVDLSNVMITDKPRYPKHEGIRGKSRYHFSPINVYVDKRGFDNEE